MYHSQRASMSLKSEFMYHLPFPLFRFQCPKSINMTWMNHISSISHLFEKYILEILCFLHILSLYRVISPLKTQKQPRLTRSCFVLFVIIVIIQTQSGKPAEHCHNHCDAGEKKQEALEFNLEFCPVAPVQFSGSQRAQETP